jgi:hypothetical protein
MNAFRDRRKALERQDAAGEEKRAGRGRYGAGVAVDLHRGSGGHGQVKMEWRTGLDTAALPDRNREAASNLGQRDVGALKWPEKRGAGLEQYVSAECEVCHRVWE